MGTTAKRASQVTKNRKSLLGNKSEAEYKLGSSKAREMIRHGISQKQFQHLKSAIGLDYTALEPIIGISRQAIHRKDDNYTYDIAQSERMFQLAELYSFGYDVFENKDGFNTWMQVENRALGGAKPIDFLDTVYGFKEVYNLIGRIEYGVYS